MAKKTPDEKANEWFGTYKETPRQGVKGFGHSTYKDIPEGITLSNVVHVSPDELVSHPLNEKFFKAESDEYFEKLTRDIKERGILVPLITKTNGTILAGHNRWKVAKDLGRSTVPLQKVINELSPRQEKEFLIKDNYLRRQLTANEKERLIRELYGEQIKELKKGGDRKSEKAKIKVQVNFDQEKATLPDQIESETGIKAGTAKRIIAKIKKKDKPETNKQSKITFSIEDKKRIEKLEIKVNTLTQTILVLEKKLADVKDQKKTALKELKTIGQRELFT